MCVTPDGSRPAAAPRRARGRRPSVSGRRHPNHRRLASLPPELRRTTVPPAVRAWVARSTGRHVAAVERLPGASSTAVHRLRFSDGASLVLRRYVWRWVLEDEPVAPEREVAALSHASRNGLPAPSVVAAD